MVTQEERLERDGAVDPVLFFWEHRGQPKHCYSSFARYPIVLPSPWTLVLTRYRTREHRFQALKGRDQKTHDAIVACPGPADAKAAGRACHLRGDWGNSLGSLCWYVMLEGVIATVHQHDEVRAELATTGTSHIYEDSPTDDIWGWRHGNNYNGKNLLGQCWMQTRDLFLPR